MMAYDMTKCMGGECPFKNDCYRFTSETLGRQDFFGSVPYSKTTNTCEYFWENTAQIKEIAYHLWLKAGCPENQDLVHWHQAKLALLNQNNI